LVYDFIMHLKVLVLLVGMFLFLQNGIAEELIGEHVYKTYFLNASYVGYGSPNNENTRLMHAYYLPDQKEIDAILKNFKPSGQDILDYGLPFSTELALLAPYENICFWGGNETECQQRFNRSVVVGRITIAGHEIPFLIGQKYNNEGIFLFWPSNPQFHIFLKETWAAVWPVIKNCAAIEFEIV
jgi:hypothetical protein